MLDNAVLAQSFVEGMDIEGFRQDRRTFYAVVRCLEIISEASRNLGDDLKGRHAGLDWRAIAGSGNISTGTTTTMSAQIWFGAP
ncbi:MAG TPA: HepT-like ribonuclease domain-containing protein [Caulobacteraceae bacterium]|nr:HepT-like ribonuclease domain-containing protein [Caulobacteraceae bacterium]